MMKDMEDSDYLSVKKKYSEEEKCEVSKFKIEKKGNKN